MLKKSAKLPITQKICLAGLLTAFAVICQKIFAINYIPVVPFLRISFCGPAVIIFASIFLGPVYGLFVGAFSDILGYLIFDPKNLGFFPQITAIYALLGFFAYFIFYLFQTKKLNWLVKIIKYFLIVGTLAGITIYLFLNDTLALYGSTYDITLLMRIIVPVSMLVLTIISEVFVILISRNSRVKQSDVNYESLNVSLIIIEALIMVLFGTLMKGLAFGFATYPAILICQIVTMFFNIPLNLFFISLFMGLTKKYR